MAMGGEGPGAITVMWVMVALTALCVSLRLYVRTILVANTGYDDHVYVLAFVSIHWTTTCTFQTLSLFLLHLCCWKVKH